ncbi:MAG TPA: carbohydrate-binding family 9-like protein [Candidatus Brocadiia bacterium]|nr:carbohydrate-binding family 9-like protein [Candidatus Brocadiia bacterium]
MEKPQYVVARADKAPRLKALKDDPAWKDVAVLEIANFPWHESGEKQKTFVRLLWDAEAVYARFECADRHISASRTAPNSDVCNDSCVEFFATPFPDDGPDYFNLEINCCGTVLLGWGPDRWKSKKAPVELIRRIEVAHSVPGPTREESPNDDGWVVECRLPLAVVSALAGREATIPGRVCEAERPKVSGFAHAEPCRNDSAGSRVACGGAKNQPYIGWLANFYRCGGVTDPQYGTWSPVAAPKPDYHRPECFGRLTFGG